MTWQEDDDAWHGSTFDLAIDLGGHDDARAITIARLVLEHSRVRAPLQDIDRPYLPIEEVIAQAESTWTWDAVGEMSFSTGFAGCLWTVMHDPETDWLALCIPSGMLERLYPVAYPLTLALNPRLAEVEEALVEIADSIAATIPFDFATLGEEAFAVTQPTDVEGVSRWVACGEGGLLIGPRIWSRLRPQPSNTITLASGLRWLPLAGNPAGRR